MANNTSHITEYKVLSTVFLVLISLVILTITVTSLDLAPYSVTVALIIAGVKAYLVMAYFMHLKYEGLLLRILVAGVFVLFAAIVVFTFIDYVFR